jgi:hypothetical protein
MEMFSSPARKDRESSVRRWDLRTWGVNRIPFQLHNLAYSHSPRTINLASTLEPGPCGGCPSFSVLLLRPPLRCNARTWNPPYVLLSFSGLPLHCTHAASSYLDSLFYLGPDVDQVAESAAAHVGQHGQPLYSRWTPGSAIKYLFPPPKWTPCSNEHFY